MSFEEDEKRSVYHHDHDASDAGRTQFSPQITKLNLYGARATGEYTPEKISEEPESLKGNIKRKQSNKSSDLKFLVVLPKQKVRVENCTNTEEELLVDKASVDEPKQKRIQLKKIETVNLTNEEKGNDV